MAKTGEKRLRPDRARPASQILRLAKGTSRPRPRLSLWQSLPVRVCHPRELAEVFTSPRPIFQSSGEQPHTGTGALRARFSAEGKDMKFDCTCPGACHPVPKRRGFSELFRSRNVLGPILCGPVLPSSVAISVASVLGTFSVRRTLVRRRLAMSSARRKPSVVIPVIIS
jgi:hypothetical protein